MEEEKKRLIKSLGMISTMGISVVVAVAIGVYVGLKLDQRLGTVRAQRPGRWFPGHRQFLLAPEHPAPGVPAFIPGSAPVHHAALHRPAGGPGGGGVVPD